MVPKRGERGLFLSSGDHEEALNVALDPDESLPTQHSL